MVSSKLQQIIDIVERHGRLSAEHLPLVEEVDRQYPFMTLADALMLRVPGLDKATADRLKARVALNAPDSRSMMLLTDPDGSRMAHFYPAEEEPETPSTDDAIDTFLDTYGNIDEHERQLLERLIFNPVADYSQQLMREAEGEAAPEAADEQDALLDAFLAKHDDAVRRHVDARPEPRPEVIARPQADAPLSESLAKIFIKQQRFDKAYEIISNLSLNNPKKSVYFADQLRFLQKLMLIQSRSGKGDKHRQ